MTTFMLRRLMLTAALLLGLGAQAQAQEYPTKPVKIIVPFAAGSATDALARLIAENLSTRWGQPVLVENRAGAGGNVGAESVFRSPPDGSALLFMPGPFVQKSLYSKLNYDPQGLVPLSAAATGYSVLVVNPKVSAQTLPELIAFAKANPDKLNYASQGIASVAHLAGKDAGERMDSRALYGDLIVLHRRSYLMASGRRYSQENCQGQQRISNQSIRSQPSLVSCSIGRNSAL